MGPQVEAGAGAVRTRGNSRLLLASEGPPPGQDSAPALPVRAPPPAFFPARREEAPLPHAARALPLPCAVNAERGGLC